MKILIILFIIFVVLVGLAAGGVFLLHSYAKAKPVVYKTAKIDTGDIPLIATATGTASRATKTFSRYEEMVNNNAGAHIELDIKRLEKENAEHEVLLKAMHTPPLDAELKDIHIARRNLAARTQQTEMAGEQADQA